MTTTRKVLWLAMVAVAIAVLGAGSMVNLGAQAPGASAVPIDGDGIRGVVTGPAGPEAGVWVIAETIDFPTKFARIVVTDDQGRYVVPDLPQAKYKVWVRGYGLIDSAKVDAVPGKQLNLTAVPAPNDAAAAQYYPAIYWYSMMKIPAADQFGGKSDIPANVTQNEWLSVVKNRACVGCHQLGALYDRALPARQPQPAHPGARQRAVQILRRLDRPCSKGRAAAQQAATAARRRAQHRRNDVGVGRSEEVSARPDRLGSALSDRQRLRQALRLAGVCDR